MRTKLGDQQYLTFFLSKLPHFIADRPLADPNRQKGNESKSAKCGLTAFLKDPITLHVRLCSFKPLSMNRSVRELMHRGLPWLPCHERFGPNMTRN